MGTLKNYISQIWEFVDPLSLPHAYAQDLVPHVQNGYPLPLSDDVIYE